MQAVPDKLFSERKSGQAHWDNPCGPSEVWVPTLQQIFHKEVQLVGTPEKRCHETPEPNRNLKFRRLKLK